MAVRIGIILLAGALVLGIAPAVAVAKQGCGGGPTVPSGSEIDQYAQFIPGSCGNEENGSNSAGGGGTSTGSGGEGSGPEASVISPSTGERLQSLGADGAATQTLAESNAPRVREDGDGKPGGSSGGSDGGGSRAATAFDALGGSDAGDGMGIVLPLALLAIAAGGALFAARKRMDRAGSIAR